MNNPACALILMSTYHGEAFLSAQVNSLLAQTFTDWRLLIRDDGSNDGTIALIKQYMQKDPRITLLEDNAGNLGIINSFARLMLAAKQRLEPYIFFCDQDDVWKTNKIQSTLEYIKTLEQQHSTDTPILVHTDLQVVDEKLNTIHPSFIEYEKFTLNFHNPIKTLIVNNYVTGCTVGMNRALLAFATPLPPTVRMHDWWCGLCAAATGVIGYIDQPTVLYRQHTNNAIGSSSLSKTLKKLTNLSRAKSNFSSCLKQVHAVHAKLEKTNPHFRYLQEFIFLFNKNGIARWVAAFRFDIKPANKLRGFVARILIGVA